MARNKLPKNILVARFSALGDVAMTIPVVYSACRANPDSRFVFLTKKHAASLFVNPPENLVVTGIDTDSYNGIQGMVRLASELRRKYNIDAFADLHDVLRTKILRGIFALRSIPSRHIHKGRRGKKALTRPRRKVFLPLTSTRMRYREVFHSLGLQYADSFSGIFPQLPDSALFKAATEPKTPGETWIGIAPFAAHRGKVYPLALMEQVVETLSAHKGNKIFLFGAGQKEMNSLGRWAMKYDNTVNLAALSIGLPSELALLAYCDCVVSMDSANMHLASLVGTRVVSVWGATHPYCGFMGWRQKKEDAVQLDMVCRPCSVFGEKPCRFGDYHCLHGIVPKMIVDTVQSSTAD